MWRHVHSILGILALLSAAGAQLQPIRAGMPLTPKRWAHVQLQNGRLTMLHDWIDLGDFAPAAVCRNVDQVLAFDHYGADPNTGDPIGGDTQCGLQYEDDRYFMGWDYNNRYYANDIASLAQSSYAGKTVTTLAHAWMWTPPDAEQCYVVILTANSFDCQNPNHDAFQDNNTVLDGIVLDYGVLSPYYSGYYRSVVCLNDLGATLRLPNQFPGAYLVVYARQIDSQSPNTLILATAAQPALWSTDLTTIGSSGARQFDDILPDFAKHTPNECANQTYSACAPARSIKFGGMMAFWVEQPQCTPCPDVNSDGIVDDADLLDVLFNFGSDGSSGGDANCDGIVDDADLLDVLFNFGGGGC